MKLDRVMQREGIRFEKVLIPSNSGLDSTSLNICSALGITQNNADKYRDEIVGIEVIRYRGEDIPAVCDMLTRKGIPTVGLTGDDLFDEYKLRKPQTKLRLLDTIDWIIKGSGLYSRPTLCVHRSA